MQLKVEILELALVHICRKRSDKTYFKKANEGYGIYNEKLNFARIKVAFCGLLCFFLVQ